MTAESNLWTPTADQKNMLGMIFETDDGRTFRYCKNIATEIGKNLMVQSEVPDAQQYDNLQNVTSPTQTAGLVRFDVDIVTGSGLVDGDLVDGYMVVNASAGATGEAGDMYTIKSNVYTVGDTVMRLEIADAGGLRNAITATSNVSFVKNKYRDLKVQPTTVDGFVIGSTLTVVPASYYFWAQTKGVASVIIDTGDTVIIGDPVGTLSTGNGTAGSVGLVATFATDLVWGYMVMVAAGADYGLVNFTNLE
jgi:hypothetical protein